MAGRSATAFNREHNFLHLPVFADRNRVEKEETFELASAARDRFMRELSVQTRRDAAVQRALMFDPQFHGVDALLERVAAAQLRYDEALRTLPCGLPLGLGLFSEYRVPSAPAAPSAAIGNRQPATGRRWWRKMAAR